MKGILLAVLLMLASVAKGELMYLGSSAAHVKTWELNVGAMTYYDNHLDHITGAIYLQVPMVEFDYARLNLGAYYVPEDPSRSSTLFSVTTSLRQWGYNPPGWVSAEFGLTWFMVEGYLKYDPWHMIQVQVGLVRYEF